MRSLVSNGVAMKTVRLVLTVFGPTLLIAVLLLMASARSCGPATAKVVESWV